MVGLSFRLVEDICSGSSLMMQDNIEKHLLLPGTGSFLENKDLLKISNFEAVIFPMLLLLNTSNLPRSVF